MPEFTGERIVPGLVDEDLYNEHVARYEFAARFVANRRVLDAGCGSGYGSALLAGRAAAVVGIDSSAEAIGFASETFTAPNLQFQTGDCLALPGDMYDAVVAFEVIEHLADWRRFLQEVRRVLAPGGTFFVSTPNKTYYAQARGQAGSNPFHVHEFEYQEFRNELAAFFPEVKLFLQNHIEAVAFTPEGASKGDLGARSFAAKPEEAHFFVAICGDKSITAQETFIWVPGTGNVLWERERHIALLASEVSLKSKEIAERNQEYQDLLSLHREVNRHLEERNRWAIETQEESDARGARNVELQKELSRAQTNFAEIAAKYQAKVDELEATNRAKTEWAIETERRLTGERDAQTTELARCAALLEKAEQTVIERTLWAQALQHELDYLKSETVALRALGWTKVGTRIGLVPKPR